VTRQRRIAFSCFVLVRTSLPTSLARGPRQLDNSIEDVQTDHFLYY